MILCILGFLPGTLAGLMAAALSGSVKVGVIVGLAIGTLAALEIMRRFNAAWPRPDSEPAHK